MTPPNEIKPADPAEALDGGRCAVDALFGVWQPIETLPRDGTPVLVWADPMWRADIAWHESECGTLKTYTHWMPLPPLPNVAGETRGQNKSNL